MYYSRSLCWYTGSRTTGMEEYLLSLKVNLTSCSHEDSEAMMKMNGGPMKCGAAAVVDKWKQKIEKEKKNPKINKVKTKQTAFFSTILILRIFTVYI